MMVDIWGRGWDFTVINCKGEIMVNIWRRGWNFTVINCKGSGDNGKHLGERVGFYSYKLQGVGR